MTVQQNQLERVPARPASFEGFVTARGATLVDGSGRELLLRGVGLGNWLLPEGYMWGFGPGAESPREIEALVARLIGDEGAARFWAGFRDRFVAEADIRRIAEAGFDHVRLPINSRVIQTEEGEPIEAGLAIIDRLIDWCREHRLWVVLDLHGAPGGQTGTNIDDSPNGRPDLFLDERHRRNTVLLWRNLAERYAAETVVLGYDLLNEPLPNEWQHLYADDLAELYRDLTREIRKVDANHLIIYEGAHWATNWDIFTEVWDANSALQFHKYWSSPDTASIAGFLEVSERLGLPIYMGEGGENTLEWLYTAFRLYESRGIGWNLWPWKKISTRTSPVSIEPPEGWNRVVASASDDAGLAREEAQRIFDDLLENMRIENCRWQPEVVAAVTGDGPSVLPAWGFGFRGAGQSYGTKDARPLPGIRADDRVSIRFAEPDVASANPFEQTDGRAYRPGEILVVDLEAGEWLEFELSPDTDAMGARALGPDGREVRADLERTPNGLRLTASTPLTLARIVMA